MQTQSLEVGLDLQILQVLLEHLPSDLARVFRVQLPEEADDLAHVVLHPRELILDDFLPIPGGNPCSGRYKGGGYNVEHTDLHDENVHAEEASVHWAYLTPLVEHLFPIHAAANRHKESL